MASVIMPFLFISVIFHLSLNPKLNNNLWFFISENINSDSILLGRFFLFFSVSRQSGAFLFCFSFLVLIFCFNLIILICCNFRIYNLIDVIFR